jgi:hypothetical protein
MLALSKMTWLDFKKVKIIDIFRMLKHIDSSGGPSKGIKRPVKFSPRKNR